VWPQGSSCAGIAFLSHSEPACYKGGRPVGVTRFDWVGVGHTPHPVGRTHVAMHRSFVTRVALVVSSCIIVVILIAWRRDHAHLVQQLTLHSKEGRDASHQTDEFKALLDALHLGGALKPDYWRVSDYLGTNTDSLEHELSLSRAKGESVTSRGFGGDIELRQATEHTFREVVELLNSDNAIERANAAKLLALYGESYRASPVDPYEDHVFSERGRFPWATDPVPMLVELLKDPDRQVRQGSALALAHLGSDRQAVRALSHAFAQEPEDTTRLYIGWALDRLIRPRPIRVIQKKTE